MARWIPKHNQQITKNEHVGRRLFEKPTLVGALDQEPFPGIDARHFDEKRDADLSLDLLGETGCDKGILKYLQPRAERDGQARKPTQMFHGWAFITAKKFGADKENALTVTASPLIKDGAPIAEDDLDVNVYHAHITRPTHVNHLMWACYLRHLFETHGSCRLIGRTTGEKLRYWVARYLPRRIRKFTGITGY